MHALDQNSSDAVRYRTNLQPKLGITARRAGRHGLQTFPIYGMRNSIRSWSFITLQDTA